MFNAHHSPRSFRPWLFWFLPLLALIWAGMTILSANAQSAETTTRVSVHSNGRQSSDESSIQGSQSISADGRFIAFESLAGNLVNGDTNRRQDIFVHDRETGNTERVSVASDGTQTGNPSFEPAISADGRFVAFASVATNLVNGDTNGFNDIFVHDRETATTTRVSLASDGSQSNNDSSQPVISADGRFVAFQSIASNLVSGDSNDARDIFLHDRQTNTTTRISVASDGTQSNNRSFQPVMSEDGRYIAFESRASNLVSDDTNSETDVFVYDRQTDTITSISVANDGSSGNGRSFDPAISGNGRFIAFSSFASNLVSDDTNNTRDIFVHDRQTGSNTRIVSGISSQPSLSRDGRLLAFGSLANNLVADDTNSSQDIFVHDRQIGTTMRVSVAANGAQSNGNSSFSMLSADGSTVVFASTANNLVSNDTNQVPDIFVRNLNTFPTTSTVAGRVTDSSGNGVADVIITAGSASTITGSDGSYTLHELTAGSYTLSAAKSGCTFTPATRSLSVPPGLADQNFTASCEATSSETWTFLLYLDGEDALLYDDLNRALQHLERLPARTDLTVAVLLDGPGNGDTRQFVVQAGGNYTPNVNYWDLGEQNVGDPATLRDFIQWGQTTYPADHYYLAIADHGNGNLGIAWDHTSNDDYLTTLELGAAIAAGTDNGQRRIDVLHYDACLMGLLENAYQVKDYADYLIFSQNLGWSIFDYGNYAGDAGLQSARAQIATIAAETSATTTPRQFAANVAEIYHNGLSYGNYPRTISVVDLNTIDMLQQEVDTFAQTMSDQLGNNKDTIQNTRNTAQKFDSRGNYTINSEDDYIDLYDFARRLEQNIADSDIQATARSVMEAIDTTVVVEYNASGQILNIAGTYYDLSNAHGIAIYFPQRSNLVAYKNYAAHKNFSFTTINRWDDFLRDYFGVVGLTVDPVEALKPVPPLSAMQDNNTVYLPLILR